MLYREDSGCKLGASGLTAGVGEGANADISHPINPLGSPVELGPPWRPAPAAVALLFIEC